MLSVREWLKMGVAYLTKRGAMSYACGNGQINRMVGGEPAQRLLQEVEADIGSRSLTAAQKIPGAECGT